MEIVDEFKVHANVAYRDNNYMQSYSLIVVHFYNRVGKFKWLKISK